MTNWLETCCAVLERRVPDRLNALDEEDRPESPWWKLKKWALHILIRIFERFDRRIEMKLCFLCVFRHGSPANLLKGQSEENFNFANYHLKGFSGWREKCKNEKILKQKFRLGKVIGIVFGILETYRQKIYVSPRVLQLSLNYLRER